MCDSPQNLNSIVMFCSSLFIPLLHVDMPILHSHRLFINVVLIVGKIFKIMIVILSNANLIVKIRC